MKLRDYIFGGIFVLAAGCTPSIDKRLLDYKMEDTGIAVPNLGSVLLETHRSNDLMHHLIRKYDSNRNKVADMIEIVTDDLSGLKPTERNLIVDINYDGMVDTVYTDMVRKDYSDGAHTEKLLTLFTAGADGKFDVAIDAAVVASLITGNNPSRKDLTLDNLANLLMDALEK